MKFNAAQIAQMLGGTIVGNADAEVHTLAKIEEGSPGSLCFLSNELYEEYIYTTRSSIAIVNQSFKAQKSLPQSLTLIKVQDARLSFAKLLEAYQQFKKPAAGVHPSAFVSANAKISATAYIGPLSSIGLQSVIADDVMVYGHVSIGNNVHIGQNTIIGEGCILKDDTVIGANCHIQPGVVIGGDGFGFAPNQGNNYQKVPHIGNVVIEDHVEIGANSTIDRATLGSTIIRKGVKLDNLIQIAHNVEIGENTVIAAQTGIAGSTKIGKNCMIGGQVGIVGHLTIADGVKIAAQSGIGHNIERENEIVQGSPAFGISDYKRSYVMFRKLPKLIQELQSKRST